jgi:hypothetical protein
VRKGKGEMKAEDEEMKGRETKRDEEAKATRAEMGAQRDKARKANAPSHLRRAWDSNPRDISAHQFSRLAPSAARTALPAPALTGVARF